MPVRVWNNAGRDTEGLTPPVLQESRPPYDLYNIGETKAK
jgi:hypothetical protein